jgi:hypothetical protein
MWLGGWGTEDEGVPWKASFSKKGFLKADREGRRDEDLLHLDLSERLDFEKGVAPPAISQNLMGFIRNPSNRLVFF